MTADGDAFETEARYVARRLDEELAKPQWDADVQLAVALSVATRIEPELIRAVRVEVLPRLDVGAESDFWLSDWVGACRPHVVSLRAELLEPLREALRGWYERSRRIRRLREVIARAHRDLSPALVLEEEISWRVYSGERGGAATARELLRGATKAMVDEKRDSVADWVVGAVDRLPPQVLHSAEGWNLVLGARRLRPGSIDAEPEVGRLTAPSWVETVLRPAILAGSDEHTGETAALHWDGDTLVIGAAGPRGAVTIPLPASLPRMVQVIVPGDAEGSWHSLAGGDVRIDSEGRAVRLHTLAGKVFEAPRAVGGTVQASPVLINVTTAGGRSAQFWLQPVSFALDRRAQDGQPTVLLAHVLDAIPADADALDALRNWRVRGRRERLRLLHGLTENDRIRLADQFAADSERHGWQVYRGRQDPDVSNWFTEERPAAGGAGILLVIDQADTWHPLHLPPLLRSVSDANVPVRILLLADATGSWWQAIVRALEVSGLDIDEQALSVATPITRRHRDVFRYAVEVIAGTLGLAALDLPHRLNSAGRFSGGGAEQFAVAVSLDTLAQHETLSDVSDAGRAILRHEHRYRLSRDKTCAEALGRLVFLATLMWPLRHADARTLSVHFGLIGEVDEWPRLLDDYDRFYRNDQGYLDPFGSTGLATDLLAAVLLDGDDRMGIDPAWAIRVVRNLDYLRPDTAVHNALVVLSRACRRHQRLAMSFLYPLVRRRPELLVGAGSAAIIATIENADTELLTVISESLPQTEDRPVELDTAAAELEELLVRHSFQTGVPAPVRDAPLHLRLARSRSRAGRLESALEEAQQASEDYERLISVDLRAYTADLCESLILESRLLGELGRFADALASAELAEGRLRRLESRPHRDRAGANLGSALANLARQKALAGQVPGARLDAAEAVRVLGELARTHPIEHEPELAEALVIASDRMAEVRQDKEAVEAARQAVTLADKLVRRNRLAHEHRLAAARLCLGARLAGTPEGVEQTELAVDLYQHAVKASAERFGPSLAGALAQHATLLLDDGLSEAALTAVEQAAELYRPRAEVSPRAYNADLGLSLMLIGRTLIDLHRPEDARRFLDEAISRLLSVVVDVKRAAEPLRLARELRDGLT